METREGDHVDSQFAEVGVELTGEPKAGGHTTHGQGDQVVEVPIGGCGQFECAEADVVEGLVVDAVGLVSVLDQLMDREGGIVGLNHCIRDFGGRDNAVCVHNSVWILLSDLRDQ